MGEVLGVLGYIVGLGAQGYGQWESRVIGEAVASEDVCVSLDKYARRSPCLTIPGLLWQEDPGLDPGK